MAIFVVILVDYSNGFNSHLVQFHPLFGGVFISKTIPENFPVLEPLEKCLLTAVNSCQKFLEFLWVFISHHSSPHSCLVCLHIHDLQQFDHPVLSENIGLFDPNFLFLVFLFASPENCHVMHSCFEGSSEPYTSSFIDIKAAFIFFCDAAQLVRMAEGKEQNIYH
jgi:hypothetical protein